MATWVSSDWHCEPARLKQEVVEWIQLGKEGDHRLIGAGDLFDILPLGREQWRQAASIEQLATLLGEHRFDYVVGNHDPYNIMARLVAPYPNIALHRKLEIEEAGRRYFISHGHRWAIDWGYLGLRRIAPWFVETMVDVAPVWWYRFCRSRGWLARHPTRNASPGVEKERITKLTRVIWAGASEHALNDDCCVVLGHTHTTGRRERGVSKEVGSQAYMVDGGNVPDGSYVEIRDDAAIKFLP